MWNKLTKSSGISWNKVQEPTKVYKEFSILQEDGYRLLQEDGYQLLNEDPEVFVEIWNRLTHSLGQVWKKFSRPAYTPQYQTFYILQENGSKILQEDGYKFLTSQLQQFYKTITKSTGIAWNKIK